MIRSQRRYIPAGPTARALACGALLLALLPGVLLSQAARSVTGTAEVNGVRLPYEICGSGAPVVLIHGWAVDRRFWEANFANLAERFRVIRYDRRGFGDATGKPDITADAADLKALLAALGISRAHLIGHSQGTVVALAAAVRYPEIVDRLVLVGPPPPIGLELPEGPETPPRDLFVAAARTYGVDSLRAAIARWAWSAFGDAPPPPGVGAPVDLMDKYRGLDFIDPSPPLHLADPARVDELGSVRAPTLLVVGDREMRPLRISADVHAYGIPRAQLLVIPGGGHVINLSAPVRFVEEVTTFLRAAATDPPDGSQ